MEINYVDIGKRIRHERFRCGISQEKLAELAGISITHMSNIENANTKLSLPSLISIANALDCDANILLCENLNNNLLSSKSIIEDVLSDCTRDERLIIVDMVQSLKTSFEKHIGKDKDGE